MAGDNVYSMDSKGRIMIPVTLRERLGDTIYVATGIGEPCLYLYSETDWTAQKAQITSKGNDKEARILQRYFIGDAAKITVDKQFRITIPQKKREYAMLDSKVVLADLDTRIELWDEEKWYGAIDINPDEINKIWEKFGL